MTLAEVIRQIESFKRVEKQKAQEKASFDYILADLIGRSVSRIHSSSNTMPQIAEVYPSLFDAEEAREKQVQQKMNLSAARFRQFADSYNRNLREVANKE